MRSILVNNLHHVESKINNTKTIIKPGTLKTDCEGKLIYKMKKYMHGATTSPLSDSKVGFSIQTTKDRTELCGNILENIDVSESLNPI
jgi:hypothetical protein